MIEKSELAQSLYDATNIVKSFVNGDLSATSFIDAYSNFYYYEALDGHELSSAKDVDERSKYWIAIELHRRIQEEVVNKLSLDPKFSVEALRNAGRIDETAARDIARAICADKGVDSILESLQSKGDGNN